MGKPSRYQSSYTTVEQAAAVADARMKVCPECVGYFVPWRHDQIRCSTGCNRKYWARSQSRGASLLPIAMEWRTSRGKAKDKLAAMCHMLDGWHNDDKDRIKKYEAAIEALKARRKKMGL